MFALRRNKWPGILASLLKFARRWILAHIWWSKSTALPEPDQVLAFAQTLNQLRAVRFLSRDSGVIVGLDPSQTDVDFRFPLPAAYAAGLRKIGMTVSAYRKAQGYARLGWCYFGQEYMLTPGMYLVARSWLEQLRPRMVLVSNDHSMRPRVIVNVARELGISSAYVQHASVTDKFPALTVDFAFLDGRDALEKYLRAGPTHTTVFLTGSPMHDQLAQNSVPVRPRKTIGICVNLGDSVAEVRDLAWKLQAELPEFSIEIRTHPGDKREWGAAIRGVKILKASAEPISEFFSRLAYLLAGDSNVHLEAAIFGLPSAYWGTVSTKDNYGFIAAGLVRGFQGAVELIAAINEGDDAFVANTRDTALTAYSATAGTAWKGRSGELIQQTIWSLVNEPAAIPAHFAGKAVIGDCTVYALDQKQLIGISNLD